jgi:hypothetical protein
MEMPKPWAGPSTEPTRVAVGVPRKLTVLVRSECDAKSVGIRAQSPNQDLVRGIRDQSVPGSGDHAMGFRFEGLGPHPYTLHAQTCDGSHAEAPFTPSVNGEHREINLLGTKREAPTSP